MKKKLILLISIVLLLSSCGFSNDEGTDTIIEDTNKENLVDEKESTGDDISKEDVKVNEMTDTRNEDEVVEEFEKDVEDILKLLEDNG